MAIAEMVEEGTLDEDFSFEERELMRIMSASEAPLRAYARYLARLETINPLYADYLRLHYPVTKLVKADIVYARRTWKNRIWMINGPVGTLKSFSAMTLASWLDQNGWWTKRKGKYDLPKIFWDYHELLDYLRYDAVRGDCLVLDEEPRYAGMGVRSLQQVLQNIEMTLRFAEINFIFVYVVERAHQVHTVFYTRGEHYAIPPLADYAVLGVLQPLVTRTQYQLLGLMTVDVPEQAIIDEYHKRKSEFVEGMQRSAGFGEPRDILRDYGWLLESLANDKKFLSLRSFKAKVDYASYTYRVQKNVVALLLSMVDLGELYEV